MDQQLQLQAPARRFPKIGRRPVIITCAVLLIAAALALNFVLFGGKSETVDPGQPSDGAVQDGGAGGVQTSEEDGYFSAMQVSRQRARDEALEVLQSVVDDENADEATRTGALSEIADIARSMEAESNIEAMVLAKGFAQCVAVINGDSCSVIVSGGALQPNQISQINEIVYEQAGILPVNVHIVTK